METLGKGHYIIVKWVFIYLHGMTHLTILYHENYEEVGVHGFVDSDWARDIDSRRSTSGYVFRLDGGAIIWMRKK